MWKKVIFADDCYAEDWDIDREFIICPICDFQYSDCECPGPTQDEWEYKEIDGVLFAKKLE